MHFAVHNRDSMVRHQFATKTADFLICGRCGVYVGAQMKDDGRYYAIANLNTIDGRGEFAPNAERMDYSNENSSARRGRRTTRWTPAGSPA